MIKKIAIRTITFFSWRLSRERLARSLHRFSQVEADSAWQLLHALDAVDDPAYRAKLFRNALEEIDHAALFSRLAREYSDFPLALTTPRRQPVYDKSKSVADFEAYLFLGEAGVYEHFLSYASASPLARLRETFLAIRGDEEGHRTAAFDELQELMKSRAAAGQLIRRNRARRLYEAWLRVGEAIGNTIFWVFLNAIYFFASPSLGWLCRRRMLIDGGERQRQIS
jgi:hypothetical protein